MDNFLLKSRSSQTKYRGGSRDFSKGRGVYMIIFGFQGEGSTLKQKTYKIHYFTILRQTFFTKGDGGLEAAPTLRWIHQ
jgi:hypothetical protein